MSISLEIYLHGVGNEHFHFHLLVKNELKTSLSFKLIVIFIQNVSTYQRALRPQKDLLDHLTEREHKMLVKLQCMYPIHYSTLLIKKLSVYFL